MSDTSYNLQRTRLILSKALEATNNLLDELEAESENLSSYDKKKFEARLMIFDNLVDSILAYDSVTQYYVRYHPAANNTKHLLDQLQIARQYINRLGGDWSIVTWGKLSDY